MEFRILAAKGNSTDALTVAGAGSASGYGDTVVIGNVDVNGVDTKLITGLGINGELITLAGNATATGTLAVTGEIAANGGIALGDNDKATFGASDDLQIYHDGSNSIIYEGGTGDLQLRGNGGSTTIMNGGGTETLANFGNNGSVDLYYDNALKLSTTATGIDISGTATMDGLTVSTAGVTTTKIEGTQAKLQFFETDTTDSNYQLRLNGGDLIFDVLTDAGDISGEVLRLDSTGIDVTGTATMDGLTVDGIGQIELNNTTVYSGSAASVSQLSLKNFDTTTAYTPAVLDFSARGTTTTSSVWQIGNAGLNSTYAESDFFIKNRTAASTYAQRFLIEGNGDISFYEDTGTTPKFVWSSSAESLGLNNINPSATYSVDAAKGIRVSAAAPSFTLQETDAANQSWLMASYGGIFAIRDTTVAGSTYPLQIEAATPSNTLYLDSTGNVGIGTSTPSEELTIRSSVPKIQIEDSDGTNQYGQFYHSAGSTTILARNNTSDGTIVFQKYDGTTTDETMRIDSSGNLLVGKAGTSISSTGIEAKADGQLWATRDGNPVLSLNRKTSDGSMAVFYKDGTSVGSIGSLTGTQLTIDSGGDRSGIRLEDNALLPRKNSAMADGTVSLGSATYRFKDLYLSGGVYLGGTGAANLLDDYEEGTWTPTAADATSGGNTGTTGVGSYTKIGNTIRVTAALTNVVTTGMTAGNSFYVQGFPFASGDIPGASAFFTGGVYTSAVTIASSALYFMYDNGASALNFYDTDGAILVSDITSGLGDFYFTAIYQTA
jgi:hypothetical protein